VTLADYLRRQFAYNAWANEEVLKTLRSAGGEDARSLQLMSHILAAERVWIERLKQVPQSVPVWPQSDLVKCEAEASALAQLWSDYLNGMNDSGLSRAASYKNSKGETWSSTVGDVLTHVAMHSAYHRGQIASHMRASGMTPAYTDFIHAIRQGFVK
jgi:uncharacterized damage-inducible protein DinB